MARAARYGNIDPATFEDMDFEEGIELARRVTLMHQEDEELRIKVETENTKSILKALGAKVY